MRFELRSWAHESLRDHGCHAWAIDAIDAILDKDFELNAAGTRRLAATRGSLGLDMQYLLLKALHVLSVVLFLGNIITGVFWKMHADRSGDLRGARAGARRHHPQRPLVHAARRGRHHRHRRAAGDDGAPSHPGHAAGCCGR